MLTETQSIKSSTCTKFNFVFHFAWKIGFFMYVKASKVGNKEWWQCGWQDLNCGNVKFRFLSNKDISTRFPFGTKQNVCIHSAYLTSKTTPVGKLIHPAKGTKVKVDIKCNEGRISRYPPSQNVPKIILHYFPFLILSPSNSELWTVLNWLWWR